MALIDTNDNYYMNINGEKYKLKNYSFSIIEDPKVREIMEYYRQGIISLQKAMELRNIFPPTIICEAEKEDEPILSRWEILDL